jgi:Fur family ferric uptake transcriptional regulator
MDDLSQRLEEGLRASGRRLTKQRRAIVQALAEGGGHLDAGALYDRVRARDPSVSLATVYRSLAVLVEIGLVREHRLGEDHSHYEMIAGTPHYHFTCLHCGRVIEFDTPWVRRIEQDLNVAR